MILNNLEAPETLVSILRCLGETLTVHVAVCLWDKQFRLALVASSLPIDYKFEGQEFYTKKSKVKHYSVLAHIGPTAINPMCCQLIDKFFVDNSA